MKGNKMNVYVVTMQRWGDSESHNYIIGVFTNIADAIREADNEFDHRGRGKYIPKIQSFNLNVSSKGIEIPWSKPIHSKPKKQKLYLYNDGYELNYW